MVVDITITGSYKTYKLALGLLVLLWLPGIVRCKNSRRKLLNIKPSKPFKQHEDSLQEEAQPINWNVSATAEGVYIPKGVIQSGFSYEHLVRGDVTLFTQSLGGWKGGSIKLSAIQVTSDQPSEKWLGDLQVASNIDAALALRIYDLYYTQDFDKKINVRAGLIDLSEFFDRIGPALMLLNSSFGTDLDISANIPVSIYPKPGLGFSTSLQLNHWKIRYGLFQNNPSDRNDVSLRKYMMDLEADYNSKKGLGGLPFACKIGVWHHSQIVSQSKTVLKPYSGYYLEVKQSILNQAYRSASCFIQWGSSPYYTERVPYYLGLGFLVNGPFKNHMSDQFSIGIANAWTKINLSNAETTLELTYAYQMIDHISIQPDIQYIFNAGGLNQGNAVALFLRCNLSLY
jgi:porin